MLDGFFEALTVVLIAYWLLWLAGVKLPGVGKAAFIGWLYLPDRRAGRKAR